MTRARMITPALTVLAMVAFAANSVITRLALLEGGEISAAQFTLIRLISGALILMAVTLSRNAGRAQPGAWRAGHWRGGVMLFLYAACFSVAYIAMPAGIGALILFACVQITMLGAGFAMGERLNALQWGGAAMAFGGLIWMLLPQDDIPALPVWAIAAMAASGAAWAGYSLLGKSATTGTPALRTAGHFMRAAILAAIIFPLVALLGNEHLPGLRGVILAVMCGALTSGLGYVMWYAALKGLTVSRAAIAQLTVPVIAALGGVLFLSEAVTGRFILSAIIVLGGVALASLSGRFVK